MKKLNLLLMLIFLLSVTVLLTYDFFPMYTNLVDIPKRLLISLIIVIVIISIFTRNKNQKKDSKTILRFQTLLFIYLVGLIVLFTILGGTSQIGLNLQNPVLWVVIVISILGILKQRQKVRRS
ncbi:hypothetical protein [Bacillus sp. Cr_A10]|uniref:hypothetical protein n=1 Tax=Bacillus sp. Cr_A10 TaxID=3033993 RepID=UPI0023DA360D|nr:hypothetical protein [Bacillus sp. Cr_A10]MDF2067465.1 hypothetical protein [Bacillus sp. Cr_A10]